MWTTSGPPAVVERLRIRITILIHVFSVFFSLLFLSFSFSCACWARLPLFILFHYSLPLFPNFLPLALRAPFAQSNQPAVNGWDYPALSVWGFFFFLFFLFWFFWGNEWRQKQKQAFATLALILAMIAQKWVCRVDALVEVVLSSSQSNECVCLPGEPRHSLPPRSMFDSVALPQTGSSGGSASRSGDEYRRIKTNLAYDTIYVWNKFKETSCNKKA